MRIDNALSWAVDELKAGESPQLDAKVLLARVLEVSQIYLFTWPERELNATQQEQFSALVARRRQGEPVAYLIGEREFWTLSLATRPSTLIPRPETELLVEQALALLPVLDGPVCDLGTGTGAIALAIASECPEREVVGVDRVADAVELASHNARRNHITNAHFRQSNWFSALQGRFAMIVTNPPYVENHSDYLSQGDVRFEPTSALTSGDDGLDDIRQIVSQAPSYLLPGGHLLIEHGFEQGDAVRHLLHQAGFKDATTIQDLNQCDRVTLAHTSSCE